MYRPRPVSLALVGLFVWVTACMSWQQVDISELPEHDRVRVTSIAAGSTEIRDPIIGADSIKGTAGDLDYAIGLNGVRTVEVRAVDGERTAAAVIGLVAVTVAAFTIKIEGYSRSYRLCCSE